MSNATNTNITTTSNNNNAATPTTNGEIKIYSASAGSGKTYTLAREVINKLVHNPKSYSNILAVTFTNKATNEMQERIVNDLYLISNEQDNNPDNTQKRQDLIAAQAKMSNMPPADIVKNCREALSYILYDYGQFTICTIDKFVQRVLRAFAYENSLPANYGIQVETDLVLKNAIDNMMDKLSHDARLRKYVLSYASDLISNGTKIKALEREIYKLGETILSEKATLLKNNNALTLDKVEVLKEQMLKKEDDTVEEIIKILYTVSQNVAPFFSSLRGNSKAKNLIEEINKEKTSPMPKNSYYEKKKRADWATERANKILEIETEKPENFILKKDLESQKDSIVAILAQAQQDIKDPITQLNTLIAAKKKIAALGLLTDLAEQIKEVAKQNNKMNISDTGELLSKLINNSDVPFIYEKCGIRYDTILMDEFQDTSKQQYENFKPLLKNSIDTNNDCLIVGDVKQSIYRFRGGDWHLLNDTLPDDFQGRTNIQNLDSNYRSKEEIVYFNNHLFSLLPKLFDQQISPTCKEFSNLYASSSQKPTKGTGGFVSVKIFNTGSQNMPKKNFIDDTIVTEYIDVVNDLKTKGLRYSDICFLTRGAKDASAIVEALGKNNIPVISEDALFVMNSVSTRYIADALQYLSTGEPAPLFSAVCAIENATNNRLTDIAENWEIGVNLKDKYQSIFKKLSGQGPLEVTNELINLLPQVVRDNDSPYIQALLQNFQDAINDGDSSIADFLRLIEKYEKKWTIQSCSTIDAVTVMTIHKSKGLEFKAVLIPHLDWKLENINTQIWSKVENIHVDDENNNWGNTMLPIDYSYNLKNTFFKKDFEKERQENLVDNLNLTYVALTRPTDYLYVWAQNIESESKNEKKEDKEAKNAGTMAQYIKEALSNNKFSPTTTTIPVPDTYFTDKKEDSEEKNNLTYLTYTSGNKPTQQPDNQQQTPQRTNINLSIPTTYRASEQAKINAEVAPEAYERVKMISYGLTMHSILEHVKTTDDLEAAINKTVTDGLQTTEEATQLKQQMQEMLTSNDVKNWFNGTMAKVWNETTMIGPNKQLRPDRVMQTNDNHLIIVDYKFGKNESQEHIAQVKQYKQWLNTAGYENIEAYIWYYTNKKVVPVK